MPIVHDVSGTSLGAMPPSLTPRPDAQLVDASFVRVVLVFVQIRDQGLVKSTWDTAKTQRCARGFCTE